MTEESGFDTPKMIATPKSTLVGGVLYLIHLFLPWGKRCTGGESLRGLTIPVNCRSYNGLHDSLGDWALILVIVIIAIDLTFIMGLKKMVEPRRFIGSGIVALLFILTLLRILQGGGAWLTVLGVILAAVMCYGEFKKHSNAKRDFG